MMEHPKSIELTAVSEVILTISEIPAAGWEERVNMRADMNDIVDIVVLNHDGQ